MLLDGSAVIGPQKISPPPTLSKELVDLPPPRSLLQLEHVKNMDVPGKAGWGLVVVKISPPVPEMFFTGLQLPIF